MSAVVGEAAEVSAPARTTLGIVVLGTLLVLMNYTAPIGTLPAIATALGAGITGQVWILGGINLGLSASLLLAGRLADRYGLRRVFLAGGLGFALTTAGCAVAPGVGAFVAARTAQGLASAALLAAGLGLIGQAFPGGPRRAWATGLWGAALGAGITLGPLFAAGLTLLGDWRLVYAVLAAAALGLTAASRRLPADAPVQRRAEGLDVFGALALSGAIACMVAALTGGRTGWTQPGVLGCLVGFLGLLALFGLRQRRARHPIVRPGLFRAPLLRAATVGALFTGLSVIGFMSYLPTVLQRVHGYGALASAGILAAWSGISVLTALLARRLPAGFGGQAQLAVGMGLCGVGVVAGYGLAAGIYSLPRLLLGLAVAGAGSGLVNAALARLAVQSVPAELAGTGSGVNNTARYLGSAVGVTAAVVVSAWLDADAALLLAGALSLLGGLWVALVGERRCLS